MFKKYLIIVLILLPLLTALIIGYPVNSKKRIIDVKSSITKSNRCFEVERFDQYLSCLKTNPKLNGITLIQYTFFDIGLFIYLLLSFQLIIVIYSLLKDFE